MEKRWRNGGEDSVSVAHSPSAASAADPFLIHETVAIAGYRASSGIIKSVLEEVAIRSYKPLRGFSAV